MSWTDSGGGGYRSLASRLAEDLSAAEQPRITPPPESTIRNLRESLPMDRQFARLTADEDRFPTPAETYRSESRDMQIDQQANRTRYDPMGRLRAAANENPPLTRFGEQIDTGESPYSPYGPSGGALSMYRRIQNTRMAQQMGGDYASGANDPGLAGSDLIPDLIPGVRMDNADFLRLPYTAARTEIPYAQQTAQFLGDNIRRYGDPIASAAPQTAFMQGLGERLPYVPTASGVAAEGVETSVPTEVWMAALELVPGIGTVPDLMRAVRKGSPEAVLAVRRAMGAADTAIQARTGQRLAGESGFAKLPGGGGDEWDELLGPAVPSTPEQSLLAKLRQERATLNAKLVKQGERNASNAGRQAMVPPPIKSDAMSAGVKRLDKLDAQIAELEAKTAPASETVGTSLPSPSPVRSDGPPVSPLEESASPSPALPPQTPPETLTPVSDVPDTLPDAPTRPQEAPSAPEGVGGGEPPKTPDTAVAAPEPDDLDGIGLPKPQRNPLPDYEPVQGIDPDRAAPRTGEPARLAGDRPRGRDRIGDQLTKDEEQRIEHFAEKARALNAPEPLVRSIVQVYRDAQSFAASANRNVGDAALWQYLAKGRAWVEGGVPDGMISAFARARLVTENALRIHIDGELSRFKGLDKQIANATVTYKGPPKYRALAEEFQAHALVTHPEWFDGVPPELAKRLKDLQKFQNDTYKIVEAIDPNAAPALDHPYLRTVWDVPESNLISAVAMPFGRASVTKKRTFPDPFEAMADKGWPYKLKADLSVEDLINSSAHLSARQIATQTERKLVLSRFGTTRKRPGLMAFRNANYGGWYAEPEVVNFVDQLHEAAPSTVRNIGNVTGTVRNTVFGVGDIGVFGQHVLNLLSTRGPVAMAGAINRSLEALHLPHMALYLDDQLPRAMARSTDGLVQGGGVYVKRSAGGNKTLPGHLPHVGEGIDDILDRLNHAQFGQVLGPLRDMTYEGNLIVNKLLHKTTGAAKFDIGNAAVRRRSAENANAFSGSSLGAFRRTRREGEQAFLGAPSITRAMAAELAQVAKLNTPEAWTTLASMAAVVYGMGSLINMTIGSGEPVAFDPRRVDWAMVHVGGEWKDVDGERRYVGGRKIRLIPQSSLVRAMGKSVQAVQDGDPARFADAWTQLAFTRSTPLIQNVAAISGVGFNSEGRFVKDMSAKDRALSALPMPLVGGGVAEGSIDPTDPVDLGTNLIGLSQFAGDDEGKVKRDVQGDRRTDIRTRLDEAGFTKIQESFTAPGWRKEFADAGMANEFGTIDELRDDWIRYWMKDKPATLTEIEARNLLMRKWGQMPVVKRYSDALGKAKLQFWKQHPDLLSDAVAAGVESDNKAEREIVEQYRQPVAP